MMFQKVAVRQRENLGPNWHSETKQNYRDVKGIKSSRLQSKISEFLYNSVSTLLNNFSDAKINLKPILACQELQDE